MFLGSDIMIPLLEFEKLIHVDSRTELKKATIQYALMEAFRTRRYAKFYTNRYYISVAFNRDYTIQLSSNYDKDRMFLRELRRLENKKWSLSIMTVFIHYWMNKLRKL